MKKINQEIEQHWLVNKMFFHCTLMITKTTEEDVIIPRISLTATKLSGSKLAGTFWLGVKTVTSITTEQKEDDNEHGEKRGRYKRKK